MSKRKSKNTTAKKRPDLQPWLNYFDMLRRYVVNGFLQMEVARHEAYVTQPALHAMSPGSDPAKQLQDGSVAKTLLRIRDYAGWLSGEGDGYLHENFAVHVVKPDEPHDLVFTALFTPRRRFFRWRDKVEIVTYPEK